MVNKILIQGFISTNDEEKIELHNKYSEGFYGEYIGDIGTLLEEEISEHEHSKLYREDNEDFDEIGGVSIYLEKASVSFYISDNKISLEEVRNRYTMQLLGALDVYGEYYGYSIYTILGFDLQNFTIGNHNLTKILSQYKGKYLNFVLEY